MLLHIIKWINIPSVAFVKLLQAFMLPPNPHIVILIFSQITKIETKIYFCSHIYITTHQKNGLSPEIK